MNGASESAPIEVTVASGHCDGHFPGNPIVPAAVQLMWVHNEINRQHSLPPKHLALRSMKCLAELKPGTVVTITTRLNGSTLHATLADSATTYSDYRFTVPAATHVVMMPSFNTGATLLEHTVREALTHWPRLWLFIDGSTDGSAAAMRRAAPHLPGLTIFESDTNRGKGAMVEWAANEARQAAISHLLVMDADGQHPADEIPRFMAASIANPEAMILGQPIFGPDAPWVRLAGRKITIALTDFETRCGGLGDTLFGFRVYPAAALSRCFNETRRGARRYDFDPEIAVRLLWNGTPPIQLAAPVRYIPATQGGVSHFHYLRDNLRMVALHCRLLPQSIFRAKTR